MGDDERRPPQHQPFERLLHQPFADGIKGAGRLIQNQDFRVFQKARQSSPVAFAHPTRKVAAFAHFAVKLLRHFAHEIVSVRRFGRLPQPLKVASGLPVTDVIHNRAAEQHRML